MLFGDLTEGAIQAGIRRLMDKSRQQDRQGVMDTLALYRGGPTTITYLLQRPGERTTKWELRTQRFALPNYLAFIIDYLSRGIYGQQVMREYEGGSETENQLLEDTLEANDIWDTQAEIAQGMVAAGDTWACVKYDEFDDRLVVVPVWPLHIQWEADPDNPQRVRVLAETRPYIDENGAEKAFTWVWVDDKASGQSWGRVYDEQGNRRIEQEGAGFDPNPYGVIPYVRWRGLPMIGMQDGLAVMRDLTGLQKLLIQQLSDLVALIVYQSHGQPVRIMGVGEDPNSVVLTGVDSMMTLANGGSFTFENPGAAIPEVLAAIDATIGTMFDLAQIPREAYKGGVAESGVALRIRWQPYIAQTQAARMRAKSAERRLGLVFGAVGPVHGLAFPADKKLIAEWDESILPTDDVADHAADLADVNNVPPLMTLEDYLLKWRNGVDTPEDAKKYLEEIRAQEPKPVEGRPDPGRFGLIEDKPEPDPAEVAQ